MSDVAMDCSAALPWVFADESTAATTAMQDGIARGRKVWVPSLWHLEIANVLLGAKKRGRIDEAGIRKFFSTLQLYDIEVDMETPSLAWSQTLALAEQYGLTAYDAAYLELALRKGLPLATLDRDLRGAATRAGIDLVLK